VRSVA